MNSIRLSIWFMWRSFVNSLKRYLKVYLITLGVILVFGFGIGFAAAFFADSDSEETEQEEAVEETADENNGHFIVYEEGETVWFDLYKDPETNERYGVIENKLVSYDSGIAFLVQAVALIASYCILVFEIWKGTKNAMNIFSMPDVNFLFPSSMKPQSVLLFRMFAQIGTVLVGNLYLVFQIPNIMNNTNITWQAMLVMFVVLLIIEIEAKIFSVFVYAILSNHPKLQTIAKKYWWMLILIPAGLIIYQLKTANSFPLYSIYSLLMSVPGKLFPYLGWQQAIYGYIVVGNWLFFSLYLILILAGIVLLVWTTWHINVDFYEDALTTAEKTMSNMEAIADQAEGGTESGVSHDKKLEKKRWEKIRNKALSFDGYEGAKVFIAKTLINRRRFYPFFGLLSPSAKYFAFFPLIAVIVKFLPIDIPDIKNVPVYAIAVFIYISLYFNSFANPLLQDMDKPFIRMLPESEFSVLGYGMAAAVLSKIIDFLPAFVLSFFLKGSPIEVILWYLILISAYFCFSSIGLFGYTVISSVLPKTLAGIFIMVVSLFTFVPLLIAFLGGAISSNLIVGLLILLVSNAILGMLFFIPCPFWFHKGEK